MSFYDKKVKRVIAIVVLVLIIAMVATSVVPYLV